LERVLLEDHLELRDRVRSDLFAATEKPAASAARSFSATGRVAVS
jgi:hypothetical protein